MVTNSARRAIRRIGVAGLLALVFVGAAPSTLVAGAATSPSHWNPQIEPIAKEVETLRHLKFEHPVKVRFLTEAAFTKERRTDRSKLSASDRADLSRAQSQLRAVGVDRTRRRPPRRCERHQLHRCPGVLQLEDEARDGAGEG